MATNFFLQHGSGYQDIDGVLWGWCWKADLDGHTRLTFSFPDSTADYVGYSGFTGFEAFNDQQQASRYTITVVARMEFRDLKSNNVLWDNPSLVYREEYDSAQGTSALDPNAFFGQEADALRRVSSEFARSVVSSILEAF